MIYLDCVRNKVSGSDEVLLFHEATVAVYFFRLHVPLPDRQNRTCKCYKNIKILSPLTFRKFFKRKEIQKVFETNLKAATAPCKTEIKVALLGSVLFKIYH